MPKATKMPDVSKRRKPDFTGVPGTLVSIATLGLNFTKVKRTSPYDELLDQLAKAQPNMALRFDDPKARVSVAYRAKKKGLVITFAEHDGKLYVKLVGHIDDQAKAERKDKITRILKVNGALSYLKITNKLRDAGDELVDGPIVESICRGLVTTGELVRRESGEFLLNPNFKALPAK